MKLKKVICHDILKILRDKEIPNDQISKVLTRLANYTYNNMKKSSIVPDTACEDCVDTSSINH